MPFDGEEIERAERRFGLAGGGPERREIMVPEQQLRGAVHRGCIQGLPHMPDAVELERRKGRPVGNDVAVCARDG